MAGTLVQRVRMNDYVGSGVYAEVTWASGCRNPVAPRARGARHFLGLASGVCVRCGAKPVSVRYEGAK